VAGVNSRQTKTVFAVYRWQVDSKS